MKDIDARANCYHSANRPAWAQRTHAHRPLKFFLSLVEDAAAAGDLARSFSTRT